MKKNSRILIIGAGSGGISVAARLAGKVPAESITILDSNQTHYYQPFWTLAGAGIVTKESSARPQKSLIPSGVKWVQEAVKSVDPIAKTVTTEQGSTLSYDYLVVASGLRLAWEAIEGISGALGKDGVCSIYDYEQVDATARMIKSFRGGRAIFVMPPVPIKCAGAPQKIMYLAEEIFERNGVRAQTDVIFTSPGKAIFGIPVFAKALEKVIARKKIKTLFQHRLLGIEANRKIAHYVVTNDAGEAKKEELAYDLLHVVPPMVAHDFVRNSTLAAASGDQKGWLEVDKYTLQHLRFPDIFGVGDVTGVPNSKTGAAVRKQAPVLVANLLARMEGHALEGKYDGYSSCPLVTSEGKVILAEFGYNGKILPSFPLDPAKERRSMWILKRYLLPIMYWHGMLRGRA